MLNFKCAARIITPGGHIYIRGRGYAPAISDTTPINYKRYLSPICVGVAAIDIYP